MKEIKVNEQIVLIDDEDYDYITTCYNLSINNHGYVQCKVKEQYKSKKMGLFSMTLHKLLVNPDKLGRGIAVDHIDGNKLNNMKSNLRVCTHEENMRNRKPQTKYANKKTPSKYKGVSVHNPLGFWRADIGFNASLIPLGLFSNEIAAANCYNYHAKIYHGEFALLNVVPFMDKNEWESYRITKNKTSKYRGVSLINDKWAVQIWDGESKKNISKRGFDSEVEAAKEYNRLAIELKGNKAKLNII